MKKNKILRIYKENFSLAIGAFILIVILATIVCLPFFSEINPNKIRYDQILKPPSVENILGTDNFGRDLLTRIIYGGRVSMKIGLQVVFGTTIFGVAIALLAGYYEKVDIIVMRAMDIMMAFPTLLLAIALSAIYKNSTFGVSIALTIAFTPRTVRILRSSILTIREELYIEAAKSIGVKPLKIMLKHVFPGTVPVLIVQETFIFAYAVLAEAGISFVGAGVQPPDASWGNILSDSTSLLREAPWTVIYPGVAIMLTVLSLNLIGDGLREILDPKRKKGKAQD